MRCCLLQLAHNIQALANKGDLTFAAVGTRIIVCKRAHRCCLCMHITKYARAVILGKEPIRKLAWQ